MVGIGEFDVHIKLHRDVAPSIKVIVRKVGAEEPALAQAPNAPPAAEAATEETAPADAQAEEEWYTSVGIQNYVFTLPLTMLERERKVRLSPVAHLRV